AVAAWNETLGALQVGIIKSTTTFEQLNKEQTLGDLKTLATDIGTNMVIYSDADGHSQTNLLSNIASDTAKTLIDELKTKDANNTSGGTLFPDAPGIGVIMANLTLDMVQARRNQAEKQLSQLAARAQLFEDAYAEMRLADQLIKEVKDQL